MSDKNGTNGNGATRPAPKLPTIDELRKIYDEGLPQTLLSGVEVYMRPIRPDMFLATGKVPDILTPIVINMLFPPKRADDEFFDEVGDFVGKPRDESKEALQFIEAVNVVCEAALIDPSIVPYLSLADRLWIFKLAFMPVAVLSTFRLQPRRDVETGDGERAQLLPSEHDDAGDRPVESVESADSLPA